MFKLVRRLILLAVLLLLVVLGALLFVGSALAKAVERGGEYALGVPVRLADASPSPLAGSLALSGLEVANPPGFATPYFVHLRGASTQVALKTLLQERIEVPSIVLEGLELNLERTSKGSNYGAILTSLERFEKGGESSEPSGKKLVVGELLLRDVKVHASLVPELGKSTDFDLKLPELRLRDIGETSMAGLVAQVIEAVLAATVDAGGGVLPKDLLKDLGGSLDNLGKNLLGDLRARLGGSLEGLDKDAKGALEGLGRELDRLFK